MKTPVWKKKRTKKSATTKLTPEQIAAARARAAEHGRRYPNLIDNMWATKQARQKLVQP